MLPEAKAAMIAAMDEWANPSSPHREGRAARAALEEARDRIRAALGWRHHLVFTSGASECAAIALGRLSRARSALVSAVEHPAVLRARNDAHPIAVDHTGLVEPGAFGAALRNWPYSIVAVQHGNSESGVLQRLADMTEAVHEAGGLLFADCAQTAGRLPLPDADLIAVSAHKFGGPPGIGALLVRDLAVLGTNGGQESGYRAGTENLPAIMGFAAALDPASAGGMAGWLEPQIEWRAWLDDLVGDLGGVVIGGHLLAGTPKTPTVASYRLPGLSAEAQLIRLDGAGFAVSAGSACSSGSLHPSHVLTAMGLDERAAREVIRVSFGWSTTRAEVEAFADAYAALAKGRRMP